MDRIPRHTYYLWTIGCQMNKADSSRLEDALAQHGYASVPAPDQASLLILNTCVVRQSAEDKVIGRMQSLRPLVNDGEMRDLVVLGCFVENVADLHARYPFVAGFYAPSDIEGVMRFVAARDNPQAIQTAAIEPSSRIAEMVSISYGCDHHCTYCIVQLRRGAQRSRPVHEICQDVERLVARGAREITLLGQNVDAYGQDLPDKPDLADILLNIHDIPGLLRIRFLTSHPRDLSQRIIDIAASLPKVCEAWELPVQSGDDQVLKRMARGYTAAHYRELVAHIRAAEPQSAINTDIIVGFPGESDEQFLCSLEMVRELRFDMVHVAAYSVRPGTVAAAWPDDVQPQVKEARRSAVEELQTEIARERNAVELGRIVQVLVDGRQKGRWRGRTRTNHLVFFADERQWLGRLVNVRITWAGPWSLIGDAVSSIDIPCCTA
ncbi:MAG: tRNA (N6-isopentenyl adenosine(37)-C2)-methylthiotransferase MiaB [Chloroflexi bacterium]|nr:tRNA (N6-isopentenyl adenosine(37)-C2)-methylthiotransferase MiaB [Chloroflexota bacterium]